VLMIEPRALAGKFAALIGTSPRNLLQFAPAADLREPATQHVRRVFMLLLDQLGCPVPPLALAELEQSLLVAFLCGNRHDHSHLLERAPLAAAPWQVCRAEEYIEAHWDEPITIEDLAAATGASVRSIFHVFKASRGYAPMAFLRQVRLRHAREMLTDTGSDASVTEVALACGFSNLGHFAREYDRLFGELPSATRNRTRGLRRPDAERGAGHLSVRGIEIGRHAAPGAVLAS